VLDRGGDVAPGGEDVHHLVFGCVREVGQEAAFQDRVGQGVLDAGDRPQAVGNPGSGRMRP
jgi:hypothetical protein